MTVVCLQCRESAESLTVDGKCSRCFPDTEPCRECRCMFPGYWILRGLCADCGAEIERAAEQAAEDDFELTGVW